jgi:hypothetical protein
MKMLARGPASAMALPDAAVIMPHLHRFDIWRSAIVLADQLGQPDASSRG